MVTTDKVLWGNYSAYEGPWCRGTIKYRLPANHDFLDECMLVLSRTEGSIDAINCYDSGIISVGMIQWIDRYPQLSVTKMLGAVAETCGIDAVLEPLKPALKSSNATFKKKSSGEWSFFFNDARGEVSSVLLQQQLYFLNASGKKGSWDQKSKEHAKLWVACMSSIWSNDCAMNTQLSFTKKRLMGFVTVKAKTMLFDANDQSSLASMIKNAYISFAANNPKWASESLSNAALTSKHKKFTKAWCIDVLHALTYYKGISIYPIRYNVIAPALEKLYDVTLPKKATDLAQSKMIALHTNGMLATIDDIQVALYKLGFDPGQIDGTIGKKTIIAIEQYQTSNNINKSGQLDETTLRSMCKSLSSLNENEKKTIIPPPIFAPAENTKKDAQQQTTVIQQKNNMQKVETMNSSAIARFFAFLFDLFRRLFTR